MLLNLGRSLINSILSFWWCYQQSSQWYPAALDFGFSWYASFLLSPMQRRFRHTCTCILCCMYMYMINAPFDTNAGQQFQAKWTSHTSKEIQQNFIILYQPCHKFLCYGSHPICYRCWIYNWFYCIGDFSSSQVLPRGYMHHCSTISGIMYKQEYVPTVFQIT